MLIVCPANPSDEVGDGFVHNKSIPPPPLLGTVTVTLEYPSALSLDALYVPLAVMFFVISVGEELGTATSTLA